LDARISLLGRVAFGLELRLDGCGGGPLLVTVFSSGPAVVLGTVPLRRRRPALPSFMGTDGSGLPAVDPPAAGPVSRSACPAWLCLPQRVLIIRRSWALYPLVGCTRLDSFSLSGNRWETVSRRPQSRCMAAVTQSESPTSRRLSFCGRDSCGSWAIFPVDRLACMSRICCR